VIALEYASMLNALPGTRITIIDKCDHFLGFVDDDVLGKF
jgi:pyruvate/2-oxoglutarate dehydrogenase complex dihydrolipoamide dehydrogenase (E3) component